MFTVKIDNAGFTDVTEKAKDYGRDTFASQIVDSGYIYVGLNKPWDRFYIELSVANTNAVILTAEYYNGSSYTSLAITDESQGFTRSGFISFDKPSDMDDVAVDSETLYWVRFQPDVDMSAGTIAKGLGVLFSNDEDLKEEFFEILQFLPSGESSFALKHQASRKQIVQEIRNRGRRKKDSANVYQHINEHDLLKSQEELREASKFLTLSKIFNNVSDDVEGKLNQLMDFYNQKWMQAFNTYWLTIDEDDDGVTDSGENLRLSRVEIVRL